MEFNRIFEVDIGTVSEQSFNFGYISLQGLVDCEFQSAIKSKFVWWQNKKNKEENNGKIRKFNLRFYLIFVDIVT